MPRTSSDGKALERLLQYIEIATADRPNTRVRRNVRLKDTDNLSRQIDLLVETGANGHLPVRIIFECKDHKRPVEIGHIEAFSKKCSKLPADKKVFVSSNGFQSGARTKAASENIALFELRKIDEKGGVAKICELLSRTDSNVSVFEAEVYCPDSPGDLPPSSLLNLYSENKSFCFTLNDLAIQLVDSDPPPVDDVPPGHEAKRGKCFSLEANKYFIRHNDTFYAVHGIKVVVKVVRGIPIGEPRRFTGFDLQNEYIDVMAIKFPMKGGIGSVGTVVDSATGKPFYIIESPLPIDGNKGFSFYVKYLANGRVHELCQLATLAESMNGGRVSCDLASIPKDARILDARLTNGPGESCELSLSEITILCEGEAPLIADGTASCYFGPSRCKYDLFHLLHDQIANDAARFSSLPLGEFHEIDLCAHCGNGDLYYSSNGEYRRILTISARIKYRRLPTAAECGAAN